MFGGLWCGRPRACLVRSISWQMSSLLASPEAIVLLSHLNPIKIYNFKVSMAEHPCFNVSCKVDFCQKKGKLAFWKKIEGSAPNNCATITYHTIMQSNKVALSFTTSRKIADLEA